MNTTAPGTAALCALLVGYRGVHSVTAPMPGPKVSTRKLKIIPRSMPQLRSARTDRRGCSTGSASASSVHARSSGALTTQPRGSGSVRRSRPCTAPGPEWASSAVSRPGANASRLSLGAPELGRSARSAPSAVFHVSWKPPTPKVARRPQSSAEPRRRRLRVQESNQ